MPYSTGYFKTDIKNYIVKKYNNSIRILDVGAGCGTYSDLLKNDGFTNIDCVEAFHDYIEKFDLKSKYQNIFEGDITTMNINFSDYDLIIIGDVLEHIETTEAQILLEKINSVNSIIGIPFNSPQGEHFGNTYEIHLQDDLTLFNFFERYKNFIPLCLRFDYGIFVNDNTDEIILEVDEKPLPNNYYDFLNSNFPNLKLNNPNKNVEVDNSEKINEVNDEHSILRGSEVTIVTAIWDLGRDNIGDSFKRTYNSYLDKMGLILNADVNMYIFADKSDEEFIWKYRKKENTVIHIMSLDELLNWFEFTNKTNEIRQNETWLSQVEWLRESPQAKLEGYNPLVMSKMFMLNNVTIYNPFSSKYFFWLDAGIANTLSYGYLTHDKIYNNLPDFIDTNEEFVFLTYPYVGGNEIHGFERTAIAKYANTDYVDYVCRGGFFGGTKSRINEINGIYYSYLSNTLNDNYMGTEESIFSIILFNYAEKVTQYIIEGNGLVWPFFESMKNKDYKTNVILKKPTIMSDTVNVALYVIGYNSPKQFETLITSIEIYDKTMLGKTKKFLLNNSTNRDTDVSYSHICEKYGFEEIKKDNIGICGGRQFIAEHSDSNNFDYHIFFEDDMFFYLGEENFCKNGFIRKINDFYDKILNISIINKFDFLKWNFTEFFGNNTKQWSWYNVPQNVREKNFPENPKKSENDYGKEPFLNFKNIKSYNGLPYATGEIYYCNWPQIVSKEGNRKMFLETKWAHPYEQTWMSFIYQETIEGKIKPGLLLATPTEHDRFDHYPGNDRREN